MHGCQVQPPFLSQGLTPCEVDPTSCLSSTPTRCVILVVYIDDILVIKIDTIGFAKVYLHQHHTIWHSKVPFEHQVFLSIGQVGSY